LALSIATNPTSPGTQDPAAPALDISASAHQSYSMRTTLNLDDDVYQAVASLSQSSGYPLGKVLSEVARRGLKPVPVKRKKNALPTFDVPSGTPMIPGMLAYKIIAEEGAV
jgi:hypothetical protein